MTTAPQRRTARLRRRVAMLSIGGLFAASGGVSAAPTVGIPVSIVPIDGGVSEQVYEGVDYGSSLGPDDDQPISTSWRLVERTGNCCENYLTTTPDGMLLDFGGQYINYSKDRGRTWRQIQPLNPMGLQSEGAIVAAPGGDILGVGWDFAVADEMLAYKYEADTEQWHYQHIPLHASYYDREWIGVVPGPVTILGQTYEYVSFIKERLNRHWLYSTDGLTYLPMVSPELQTMEALGTAAQVAPLPVTPDPSLDWGQSNANTGIIPLGSGGVLAVPGLPDGLANGEAFSYSLLDPKTFSWSPYAFPGGEPTGWVAGSGSRHQVDSAGRIHNVLPRTDGTGFAYRISTDNGVTWQSVDVALPPGNTFDGAGNYALGGLGVHQWDFRANRSAGVGAVAIRAADATTETNRDLVYKFDITGDEPRLSRMWQVGLGDVASGQGATDGSSVRMDFGNVAIFADGRVAVSFIDSTTKWTSPGTSSDPYEPVRTPARGATVAPAIAIEGDTQIGPVPDPYHLTLQASRASVRPSPQADNTADITATVVDSDGHPVVGKPVAFSFLSSGSGAHPLLPTLSSRTATTNDQGQATITYTSGYLPTRPEAPVFPQDDTIEAEIGQSRATVTIEVDVP